MVVLHLVALFLGLAGMAWIAREDFLTLKVSNLSVIILTAIGTVVVATDPTDDWRGSLLVATALFAFGFILWTAKLIGAGDAKFYFPLGLIVGWSGIGTYVVILLVTSTIFLVVLRLAAKDATGRGSIRLRLAEIAESRRVPYAVPMAISAILAVLLR